MARFKIHIPSLQSIFTTQIPIQISDLNYGNHMGNDRVYLFCHEARIRFFKKNNQSELDFLGSSLIMADSACVYKKEGHWGDTLKINLHVGEFTTFGFDFYYQLNSQQTSKEIARVKTGMVFYDYAEKKLKKIPSETRQWFDRLSISS